MATNKAFNPLDYGATPVSQDEFNPLDHGATQVTNSEEAQQPQGQGLARRILSGIGKFTGITGTARGFSEAARVAKGLITGKEYTPQISPKRFAGSAGTLGLNLATLGGVGTAGGIGAQIGKNALLGAGYGVSGALEQDKNPTVGDIGTGLALGGALPGIGKGVGIAEEALTNFLPKRLIAAYIPATKDVSSHVLENTKLGFTKTMIADAKTNISKLSNQINEVLEKKLVPATYNMETTNPSEFINKNKLLKSVAQSYGQTGGSGTITGEEVKKNILKVAPQIRGLLEKQNLTLPEANNIRKAVDQSLGDRFFLSKHSPFTKEVAGVFNDFLRNEVKNVAPETRQLFDELSKEITVKNALEKSSKKFAKVNLRDLASLVAGATVHGPLGAVGAVIGERAFSSPAVGVGAAKALFNLGKMSIPETGKRILRAGALRAGTK